MINKKEFKNLKISYFFYQTIIGTLLIASTEIGICYVGFDTDEKPVLPYLKDYYSGSVFYKESKKNHFKVIDSIYEKENNEIIFHLKGTTFQIEVWSALLEIPNGYLTSYSEIAKKINHPKAFRAVGTAIGKNPISILIPCHRVIQTNGNLGGYMWGLPIKTLLIGLEL